jgi:asparagine synthase (glutamine-hydrolysing)
MNRAQAHRGPDAAAVELTERPRGGLAVQRLALIDPSHGRQPFVNETGTVRAVINGEIYNHDDLRRRLQDHGHRFRSACDGEVVVHLYEEEGVEFLSRLDGMFALAVVDEAAQRLLLARDPAGMKHLYLACAPGRFAFASEAKALLASGLFPVRPDADALLFYLRQGFIPAPWSAFSGLERLESGTWLLREGERETRQRFWRYAPREVHTCTEAAAAEHLEHLLRQAVVSHRQADRPVGAFLSGGWDSSLVARFAAEAAGEPLRTFSIVFPDFPGMDETRFSRQVAGFLGSNHTEVEFRADQAVEDLTPLCRCLDEPCSAAPAEVLFQLARGAATSVRAVQSGEGADELLGGYERLRTNWVYTLRRLIPAGLAGRAGPSIPPGRLRQLSTLLAASNDLEADATWMPSFFREEAAALLHPALRERFSIPHPPGISPALANLARDLLDRRLCWEFTSRLAEGLLFIGDRTTMAHSLEARMPFLSRPVMEFCLAAPSGWKIRNGRHKVLLAYLARKFLPPEIAARTKKGLGCPPAVWTRPQVVQAFRRRLLDAPGPFDRTTLERNPVLRRAGRLRGSLFRRLIFLQGWWDAFGMKL